MNKHSIYYGLDNDTTRKEYRKRMNIFRGILLGFTVVWLIIYCRSMYYDRFAEIYILLALYLVMYLLFRKYKNKLNTELFNILYLDCDPVKLHNQFEHLVIRTKRSKQYMKIQYAMLGKFASEYFEEGYEALKEIKADKYEKVISLKALECSYALRRDGKEEYFRLSDEILNFQKPKNKKQLKLYETVCATITKERLYLEGKYEEALKLWLESYRGDTDTSLVNVVASKRIADCKWELGEKDEAVKLYKFVVANGGTTYLVELSQQRIDSY